MKRLIIIISLAGLVLSVCGPQVRQNVIKVTDEFAADIKNFEETSLTLAKVTPFLVCWIREELGHNFVELRHYAVELLDKLDKLSKKDALTPCEAARISAMWARFAQSFALEVLKIYAPDVLNFLKIF